MWLSAQVLPSGARPGKNNAGPRKNLDDWRVCIAFGDLPRQLKSGRQALIPALRIRLSGQVAVSSSGTQIFLYAPSAGSADEAAQVAREVLARHDVSAHVRTERWSPREQEWRDAADEPDADVAAGRQAVHEYRQEHEREVSLTNRFPAWQVRVELSSHRDVVALAGHLAAQGWRVRPRRRYLIVGADCEDDAKGLARELSGDGRADADTAFRVGRVSFSYMHAYIEFPTQLVLVDPGRLRVLRPTLWAGSTSAWLRGRSTRAARVPRALPVPKTYATRRYSWMTPPHAVVPPDAEMIQVCDAIWQRPQWRGLVQSAVRPVGVVEVLVLPQHHHQVVQVPDQGPVQQLTPAAANPPLRIEFIRGA